VLSLTRYRPQLIGPKVISEDFSAASQSYMAPRLSVLVLISILSAFLSSLRSTCFSPSK
jgi:hypothetical protein